MGLRYWQRGNCTPVSWFWPIAVLASGKEIVTSRAIGRHNRARQPGWLYRCATRRRLVRRAVMPLIVTDDQRVMTFSTKNSLLLPDLKRTFTLPVTGQGT